jgi:drug/metabolite transporter (DMT)-like permease
MASHSLPLRISPSLSAALRAATGIAFLTCMDAVIKSRFESLPFIQVVFLRFLAGCFIVALVWCWTRPALPDRARAIANGTRGALTLVTATSFFYSVKLLPLAEALALSFLAPVFVAVLSTLILREQIGRAVMTGLIVGCLGMVAMVWPKFGGADGSSIGTGVANSSAAQSLQLIGIAAALFSAVTYALNLVLLRKLALRDHVVVIVASQNIVPMVLLLVPAWLVWQMPTAIDVVIFASAGLLAVSGHLLLTSAFARAEASKLAVMDYTALIWGSGLGYLFFNEIPTWATLAGAVLIVMGAVLASRR